MENSSSVDLANVLERGVDRLVEASAYIHNVVHSTFAQRPFLSTKLPQDHAMRCDLPMSSVLVVALVDLPAIFPGAGGCFEYQPLQRSRHVRPRAPLQLLALQRQGAVAIDDASGSEQLGNTDST